ncbi:cobalamin-dependent protein [Tsuneonella sp. YG55]|uniref:Cobalamin-dependent protein n=1 Tax=Tsuneonella litorea TaxID=2976475 RepID=A0A9X3ALU4_9SPHN|nr:cobalamin-dependent protein [Tsuneonella litorea]MCT2557507.1 cobalamin-dependent protein [Tsuneonella litorea]
MQDRKPRPRVLLTKSFIDSHDRAIETIALALRDAAMEVVLIDYEQPEDVVNVALQEDVDVIGVSFMSGGQVEATQKIVAELERRDVGDLPLVVGGIIRPFDEPPLIEAGVKSIFRGGAPLSEVVSTFENLSQSYRGIP